MPLDLRRFEAIDWDDEEDDDGNLAHCLRHDVDERVVDEVLSRQPVEVRMKLKTAEYTIVGPDRGDNHWTILFDTSFKRGDWLRPVTGWRSSRSEIAEWAKAVGG